MNLRNIFTTALGCFTILAACGNDNDSNITPTPEPKPDQPTEEVRFYVRRRYVKMRRRFSLGYKTETVFGKLQQKVVTFKNQLI